MAKQKTESKTEDKPEEKLEDKTESKELEGVNKLSFEEVRAIQAKRMSNK